MFSFVLLLKSKFLTCVALVLFALHLYHTGVVCVALVFLVSGTCVARLDPVGLRLTAT